MLEREKKRRRSRRRKIRCQRREIRRVYQNKLTDAKIVFQIFIVKNFHILICFCHIYNFLKYSMRNFPFSEPCIVIRKREYNQWDAHSSIHIMLAARHPEKHDKILYVVCTKITSWWWTVIGSKHVQNSLIGIN
jgi:hypothetical protein